MAFGFYVYVNNYYKYLVSTCSKNEEFCFEHRTDSTKLYRDVSYSQESSAQTNGSWRKQVVREELMNHCIILVPEAIDAHFSQEANLQKQFTRTPIKFMEIRIVELKY